MRILRVRGVPDELYEELRALAQIQGRSLSAEVIALLQRAPDMDVRRSQQGALLDVIKRRRFTPPQPASDSLSLLREERERMTGDLPAEGRMDWREYIVIDPEICHGQACVKGTRIMVSVVLDNLAAGASVEDVLQNYPMLSAGAVRAVMSYAAELARQVGPTGDWDRPEEDEAWSDLDLLPPL